MLISQCVISMGLTRTHGPSAGPVEANGIPEAYGPLHGPSKVHGPRGHCPPAPLSAALALSISKTA